MDTDKKKTSLYQEHKNHNRKIKSPTQIIVFGLFLNGFVMFFFCPRFFCDLRFPSPQLSRIGNHKITTNKITRSTKNGTTIKKQSQNHFCDVPLYFVSLSYFLLFCKFCCPDICIHRAVVVLSCYWTKK